MRYEGLKKVFFEIRYKNRDYIVLYIDQGEVWKIKCECIESGNYETWEARKRYRPTYSNSLEIIKDTF